MPLRESREKAGKVQICEPGYLPVLCDQKLPFKASTQIRRIYQASVPRPFRGAPVVLLSAALMSIAFMGFAGLSL